MSLVGYKPPVETVEFKGGSFQVKGLSLNDVSTLVQANLSDMEQLFGLFDKAVGNGANMDIGGLASTLIAHAPGFVAATIALACTEQDDFEVRLEAARILPMPVQIDAIKKIGAVTFEEAGGVKKFLENLTFLKGALRTPTISQVPDPATAS
jgi:hypothetical protein